ncbi:MAG: hypothetical protein ACFFCM_22490, partial [Promethearchaeota archaeon]
MKIFDIIMELEKKEHFPSEIIEEWIKRLELYIKNGYWFPCPCVRFSIYPSDPECFYHEDAKNFSEHFSERDYCLFHCERALLYNENIREFFNNIEEEQIVRWRT